VLDSGDFGILAVLAGLVAERFYQYLRARGVDLQEMYRRIKELHDLRHKIHELHRLLSEEDANGVRRIYFREDARSAILETRNELRVMAMKVEIIQEKVEEIWRKCIAGKPS